MYKYRYLFLLLSFSILITLIWFSNPQRLIDAVIDSKKEFIFYAFVVSSFNMILRIMKWKILTNFSFRDIAPVHLFGVAISNFTPGKVAEPFKALLMKIKKGVSVSSVLPSIAWERILDIVTLVVLSIIALHFLTVGSEFFLVSIVVIGIFSVLVVLLLMVIHSKSFGYTFFGFLRRFPLLKNVKSGFIESFYEEKIERKRILYSLILTFIVWVLDGAILYLVLLSFGINSSPIILAGIVAISILVGVASWLPGGIGSAEVTMIFLLGLTGVENSVAVASVLITRFITFWYGAGLGALSFAYLSKTMDLKKVKFS